MDELQVAPPGMMVYGADGETVGTVTDADNDGITVDTGRVPTTLYIPLATIFETDQDGIHLSVSQDDAMTNPEWVLEPEPDMLDKTLEVESRYSAVEHEDSLDPTFATLPTDEE